MFQLREIWLISKELFVGFAFYFQNLSFMSEFDNAIPTAFGMFYLLD
jgi:hypothetical protein